MVGLSYYFVTNRQTHLSQGSWPRGHKDMSPANLADMESLYRLYRSRRIVAMAMVNSIETRTEAAQDANRYMKQAVKVV